MSRRALFIDFLRGLSVLGILYYHIVPGAAVGLGQGSMEFFFVISGYLITKTFAGRLTQGLGGLKNFALSRAKRLLPALSLYIGFIIIINLAKEKSLILVFKSSLWALLGFYNYFQIFSADTICGLGGIWSLSIEDQYYYLMLIIGCFFLIFRIKKFAMVFLGFYIFMAFISLAMRMHNAEGDYSLRWISYNTVSRLMGFSCGGIVACLLELEIGKFRGHKAKILYSFLAIVALFAAYMSLLSVKAYTAQAFLAGWLCAPLLLSVCIYAYFQSSTQEELSSACLYKQHQKRVPLNRDLFVLIYRLPRIPFMFVSKVGVACYPIYLFQESDVLLGIKVHWVLSLGWALVLGFAVHNLWERRFYVFPRYSYLAAPKLS
jgi:peptidoglycan/LPS O-acetylase OafA/YrhL